MERLFSILVLGAALGAAGRLLVRGVTQDPSPWDPARFTPTFAWVSGFQVYPGRDATAIQTAMYPPGWILAYLPCTLAATPEPALLIGRFLAQFFTVGAAALYILSALQNGRDRLLALTAFVFLTQHLSSLTYSCYRIHADAPSLGFALLGCLALLKAGSAAPRTRWHWGAAFALWFSVWTKQVMASVLPAALLYVLLVQGRSSALKFLLRLVLVGAALSAFFLALFPLQGLWLNCVVIPGRCPWVSPGTKGLVAALRELLSDGKYAILGLMACQLVVWAGRWKGKELGSDRRYANLALWFAAALVPGSVLGIVKVGGSPNVLSPTTYFLCVGLALEALHALRCVLSFAEGKRLLRIALLFAFTLASGKWLWGTLTDVWHQAWPPEMTDCSRAYAYLRSNPYSGAYFPELPLAHLLAEGRLYHFSGAVHDRVHLANIPLTDEQFHAGIPQNVRTVFWGESFTFWGSKFVAERYLSEYQEPCDGKGLRRFNALCAGKRGRATLPGEGHDPDPALP